MLNKIYYNYFTSPVGTIYMAFSSKGICQISLTSQEEGEFCQKIEARLRYHPVRDQGSGKGLRDEILSYLAGERRMFTEYELDISQGSPFQIRVWEEVKKITYGKTRSYQWIARQVGLPSAQRAVGQANGRNPIPIIIPCHRVIRSDGNPGGYGGGVDLKKRFLKLEGVNIL